MRTTLFIAFAAASSLSATTINTGQLGTMQTFSDPVWTIAAAPAGNGMNSSGPAFLEHNNYPQPGGKVWNTTGLPPISVANYISAGDCGRIFASAACPGGVYKFVTSFSIANPASALLTFSVAGDNRVEVYLNNNFLYGQGDASGVLSTGWAAMSAVQTITNTSNPGAFTAGNNTLELRVINDSGFTGGILVGNFTTAPEPATTGLAGVALSALGLALRRRNNRRNPE